MLSRLIIGTRQSQLAIWQAEYIAGRIHEIDPQIEVVLKLITTHGDRVLDKPLPEIGGKGVFTAELETALREGTIDLAVHSLKDLPTTLAEEFIIGAIPVRASPYDALISRSGAKLLELAFGATVGTSSLRRIAQLKAVRSDLTLLMLRGNVPTRLNKARAADGPYDAIVLAEAGLDRLGLADAITEILPADLMLPAPAQGALGIQCRRADQTRLAELLSALDHAETRTNVEAERTFLNALDSGCRLPVAALATNVQGMVRLRGRVASLDGQQVISIEASMPLAGYDAGKLGQHLAQQAIADGADKLLDEVRKGIPE